MKKLSETRDYLQEWIRRFGEASKVAPEVQRSLDEVNWQVGALGSAPDPLKQELSSTLENLHEQEYDLSTRLLPMMPDYGTQFIPQISTVCATGTTVTYTRIMSAQTRASEEHPDYYDRQRDSYVAMKRAQNQVAEVGTLLLELMPGIAEQFHRALDSYDQGRAAGDPTAAALEMRTFLDKLKGEMFSLARDKSENMTWPLAAEKLCPSRITPAQNTVLLNQDEVRARVFARLSEVAKRRSDRDIASVWALAVDHAAMVLRAIMEGRNLQGE